MSPCACPNGQGWADDAITLNWADLKATIPPQWLPKISGRAELTQRVTYQDFGCGNYGCVYPTSDPAVVFKITTDASEVEFIGLNAHATPPEGVVKYFSVWRLQGKAKRITAKTQDRADLYVILREAADGIGKVRTPDDRPLADAEIKDPTAMSVFLVLLRAFKEGASALRKLVLGDADPETFVARSIEYAQSNHVQPAQFHRLTDVVDQMREGTLVDWHISQKDLQRVRAGKAQPDELVIGLPKGQPKLAQGATLLSVLDAIANKMAANPVGEQVGVALRTYLQRDMLLADVHFKNVGLVSRRGRLVWAITDPGHLVRLSDQLPDVLVPWLSRV